MLSLGEAEQAILKVMKNLAQILLVLCLCCLPARAQENGEGAGEKPRLTLAEVVAVTIEKNPDLMSADAAAQAAKFRVDQANTAYSPTLNLSSNYNHSDSTRGSTSVVSGGQLLYSGASGSGSSNRTQDTLGSSLNARIPLFDATRGPNVKQAKESLTASKYDLERTAQELILQVRTAYYKTLLDQQLVDIQRQRVENNELRLKQAQGFYEAGTSALVEVTQAQSALASAQLELSRAEAALEIDWVTLNTLMGQPAQTSYLLESPELPEIPEYSVEKFMEVALEKRPELQAGWARVRAQLARIDAAVAGRWPTLSASLGYNINGQPTPFDRTWTAGIVLNWALFDGGADRAQAAEAKASAEQLKYQVESTGNSVYQEIANAITGWRTSRVQLETAEVGVRAAEQNRYLAAERYRVGVGNSLELSDAELALTQARSELAQALNASQTAAAQLSRALGVVDLNQITAKDMS